MRPMLARLQLLAILAGILTSTSRCRADVLRSPVRDASAAFDFAEFPRTVDPQKLRLNPQPFEMSGVYLVHAGSRPLRPTARSSNGASEGTSTTGPNPAPSLRESAD